VQWYRQEDLLIDNHTPGDAKRRMWNINHERD
jgi:hypothetical protein